MDLRYNMATNQQWFGRENSRAGGGSRSKIDQITALTARAAEMEKALIAALSARAAELEEAMQRAFNNYQPQPCVMCGDRSHSYEYCPLAEWDEEPEQYIDPAFMHEQEKMNQMMWNQVQSMSAQMAAQDAQMAAQDAQMAAQDKLMEQMSQQLSHIITSSQPQPGKLPAQPEPNPRGETKTGTLRSGTQFESPAMPDHAVKTDDLGEPGRDPHEFHASRVPHDLEIRGSGSDDTDATRVTPDATRIKTDATRVIAQTEPPTPELKPLPANLLPANLIPANLRYEFLDPDKSCFVIISADLEPDRTATPLENLKGAIGCSIKGWKEILRIHLMQEFDRVVRVPLKWVLPPVPPDPPHISLHVW